MIIETRAFARAGLLGNPSDGYYGKTISVSIRNFGARILMFESPELVIEEQAFNDNQFRNMYQLVESVKLTGYYGGSRLIKAAIVKFWEYCNDNKINIKFRNFTVRYQTSIPRQVGLAGSSAIVTATFRALMKFYNIDIPKHLLPTLILKAETEELGINAGLQDRVIQVYEGCVFMDFEEKNLKKTGFGKYKPLNAGNLPNIYLAYKTDLSKVSGTVLNNIKERYYAGDQVVIDTLKEIAQCAEDGITALQDKDFGKLNALVNKNFDLRCKIMNISESNLELVNTARNCGASAKFSGSGGAIIGFYEDDEMLRKLIVDLRRINARVIKPYIE